MMNEKREDYNAILFISIILLAVGFIAAVYFLFKKENKLALEYFLAGLLGGGNWGCNGLNFPLLATNESCPKR